MNKNKRYNVKNRSSSVVVVRIPEISCRKEFQPGETLPMTYDELEKLSYQPGGRELMANFLQIMEDEVNDNLNIPRENEYYMSEEQIVDMLKNGSIDQLKDCLDFAPIGVIDLVKKYAVALPVTDTVKIAAIKDKLGFDVETALRNMKADQAEEKTESAAAPTSRRTTVNYKVVNKKSE